MSSQAEMYVFYLLLTFTLAFEVIIMQGQNAFYSSEDLQRIKEYSFKKFKELVITIVNSILYYLFYFGLIYGTLYTDYWLFQYCLSMAILRSTLNEITFNLDAPAVIYMYGTVLLIDSLYKAQNQNMLMYVTNEQ